MAGSVGLQKFDGVAVEPQSQTIVRHPIWGSARLAYTICAFFAMIMHMCMRNTIHFTVLFMVKTPEIIIGDANSSSSSVGVAWQLDSELEEANDLWTRDQQFSIQGTFYYGYVITVAFSGYLADRFGGKFLFVHSLTVQAIVFMLTPICAHWNYTATLIVLFVQGLIAGCGNPAIYQLFTTWAHHTERTILTSITYSGFSVGSLIVFPITAYFCEINWEISFYILGAISLVFGICCNWVVYNTLEEHPRISLAEYTFLKSTNDEKQKVKSIPWKAILTSIPVHAFILTHIFHSYGILLISIMMPRFLKEGLDLPLSQIGWYSSTPFVGACLAKAIVLPTSYYVERKPNINITKFRKIWYAANMIISILLLLATILLDSANYILIIVCISLLGTFLDLGFSAGYWPSLLYLTPSFAGFLSGIANSLGTFNGFISPIVVSALVTEGHKEEWNLVLYTILVLCALAGAIFGLFSSSELHDWSEAK